MAKPEPGANMFFGWERDKNVSDFLIVEENLRKEGMSSRANAVRYLIERIRVSEATLRAIRLVNDIRINFTDSDGSMGKQIEKLIEEQIPRSE
jgi:hypothetical protein